MKVYLANNPAGKHGKTSYTLDEYGWTVHLTLPSSSSSSSSLLLLSLHLFGTVTIDLGLAASCPPLLSSPSPLLSSPSPLLSRSHLILPSRSSRCKIRIERVANKIRIEGVANRLTRLVSCYFAFTSTLDHDWPLQTPPPPPRHCGQGGKLSYACMYII